MYIYLYISFSLADLLKHVQAMEMANEIKVPSGTVVVTHLFVKKC